MSTPFGRRSWLGWAGAGAACLGVGLLGTLIPIQRAGEAGARPLGGPGGASGAQGVAPTACVGSPARVAALGGTALVARQPSRWLSSAIDAALASGHTQGLAVHQVDVLDATNTAAEVVIGTGASAGPAGVGIALGLDLGCVGGHRVVVGGSDVAH